MAALFKQEAHKLVDQLSDTAGWDELIYEAALHRAIEQGLAEADAGHTIPIENLLKDYDLDARGFRGRRAQGSDSAKSKPTSPGTLRKPPVKSRFASFAGR